MSDMITRSIIVKGDVDPIYRLWENFENFPMFMKNIKSVTDLGNGKSHWVMEGPLGKDVEWNSYLTRQEKNKRLAWSTKDDDKDSDLTTSGQVTFNELSNNETEVTVMMQYIPKQGIAGDLVAKLLGNPEGKLEEDLRRFKTYAESMVDSHRL